MDELSAVTLMKFKNTVERILHVKGNYQGGILEMTVVVDNNLSKQILKNLLPKLLQALKLQGETFRNVRFNYGIWKEDGVVKNQVCPMMSAISQGFYEEYEQQVQVKQLGSLIEYLKLFHARSKLILVLKEDNCQMTEAIKCQMQPFLDKKLMLLTVDEKENTEIYYRNFPI